MDARTQRVRAEFDAVDRATAGFVAAGHLACPPGCGACCNAPEIEATVGELLPMAEALDAAGRAGEVLSLLEVAAAREADRGAPPPSRCVMYQPDPVDAARGRCGAYSERPLVCRVFGFGARLTRTGRRELVACRVMRLSDPERMQRVEADDAALAHAPLMADHGFVLGVECSGDEARPRPINLALREALERVVLGGRMRALADAD